MHGPWRFLRRAAIPALGILLLAVLIDGFLVEPNRLVERALTLPCPGLHARPGRIALFSARAVLPAGRRAGAGRSHRAGVGDTGPASVGGRRRLAPLDSRAVGEVPRTRRGGV